MQTTLKQKSIEKWGKEVWIWSSLVWNHFFFCKKQNQGIANKLTQPKYTENDLPFVSL